MEIWQIILSSALVSSIITSFASWVIGNHSQNKSFKNDYYKSVIKKRMDAYQYIDDQLRAMKVTTLDNDAKPYHSMFYGNSINVLERQQDFMLARANGVWLSNEMEEALTELNQLLFEIDNNLTDEIDNNVALAKRYYSQLSNTRMKVEDQLRKDMLELYKVEIFLKDKKKIGAVEYQFRKFVKQS